MRALVGGLSRSPRRALFNMPVKALPAIGARPTEGEFYSPSDVAVAKDGSIFVVDSGNSRIQKLDASGTFVKAFGSAQLDVPLG